METCGTKRGEYDAPKTPDLDTRRMRSLVYWGIYEYDVRDLTSCYRGTPIDKVTSNLERCMENFTAC